MYQPHNNGPTIPHFRGTQFQKLNHNDMCLSIRSCDNCVILSNGDVYEIENLVKTNREEILMLGRLLPLLEAFMFIQWILEFFSYVLRLEV